MLVAAAAFTPGVRAALDGRVRWPRRLRAGALSVLALPSACFYVVVRAGDLTVRQARGEVMFDGNVLLTVVPYGSPRGAARVAARAALGVLVGVLLLVVAFSVVAAAAPAGSRAAANVLLGALSVLPFLLRLPPGSVSRALKTHREANRAALVADLARSSRAPAGAAGAAVRAYLSVPDRPPVVGVATAALWDRVYRHTGLRSLALHPGWPGPLGRLRPPLRLVYG